MPDALDDPTSPEYAALEWMTANYIVNNNNDDNNNDMLLLPGRHWTQPYALLAMDFGASRNNRQQQQRRLQQQQQQPQFATVSSNDGMDECSWKGVTCVNDTVTQVVWANQGLSGHISPEVQLLQKLTLLDLGENNLQGSIPESLYEVRSLEYLYLHQNRLVGSISEKISNLFGLINLYLNGNLLTGNFPSGLGSPTRSTRRPLRTSFFSVCWIIRSFIRFKYLHLLLIHIFQQ